jgi:RNA polymerase sigma-70 factor (family 1)
LTYYREKVLKLSCSNDFDMSQPLPIANFLSSNTASQSNQFPGITTTKETDVDSLIMRVIEGDDYFAFELLFKKMYNPLCQFCIKFVKSSEVAEELVSDVFYSIWKNRNRLIISSPKAYLFTSVRNKAYDHLRKVKKQIHCDLENATNLPADTANSQEILVLHELTACMEQSIARLPKQCRLIYELSRDQGLKYKEIATILRVSVKTVETQMGRALKHLRNSMPLR